MNYLLLFNFILFIKEQDNMRQEFNGKKRPPEEPTKIVPNPINPPIEKPEIYPPHPTEDPPDENPEIKAPPFEIPGKEDNHKRIYLLGRSKKSKKSVI